MVSIMPSRISLRCSLSLCNKLLGIISMRDSRRQQINHRQLHWLIMILINHRLLDLLILSRSQLVKHMSSSTANWRMIIKMVRIEILLWIIIIIIIAILRGRYEHIVILLNLWKWQSSRMDIVEDKGFPRTWSINKGLWRIKMEWFHWNYLKRDTRNNLISLDCKQNIMIQVNKREQRQAKDCLIKIIIC